MYVSIQCIFFFLALRLLSYISLDLPSLQETSKSYLTPQWTMLITDLLNPKSPDNPGNSSFNIMRWGRTWHGCRGLPWQGYSIIDFKAFFSKIHCTLSAKLKLKHRASKTNNSNLRGVLVNRVFFCIKRWRSVDFVILATDDQGTRETESSFIIAFLAPIILGRR